MSLAPSRILYCASEAYPLIKTGGLADVAGSLVVALQELGHDVQLLLPAYRAVLQKLPKETQPLTDIEILGNTVQLLRSVLPGTKVPVILVHCPTLYDREGTPYHDASGSDWLDNAMRFAVLSHAAALIAQDKLGLNWRADIVHANDWQTGLVPALLHNVPNRPALIFTIHNLAYQGLFDRDTFVELALPEAFWHFEALEYHGGFSFIKGGLIYADRINTVSPNYAKEIQTNAFGHGLEALLQYRSVHLNGILNGIDTTVWNPVTDPEIAHTYDAQHLQYKSVNKTDLQRRYGLPEDNTVMLMGLVSRIADQKGIDLILHSLPHWISNPIQWVILGSGDKVYENLLLELAQRHPHQIGVRIGYDESLAHRIEAGTDVFLMPSRFEPCGLNQLYSQRYGTLPIVSPVGGLFDTVTDVSPTTLQDHTATGFILQDVSIASAANAIERALNLFINNQPAWRAMQTAAMQKDYSWQRSAVAYTELYAQALIDVAHII